MSILDTRSDFWLRQAQEYLSGENSLLYKECISFLLSADTVGEEKITEMLTGGDPIKRKFAAAAANKLYEKYPDILRTAQSSKDKDISSYAELQLTVKKTSVHRKK